MRNLATYLAPAEMLLLASCGQLNEARSIHQAGSGSIRAVHGLGVAASKNPKTHQAAQTAQRDTASLTYEHLQGYLPGSIAGFVAVGQPRGECVTLSGISYSTCQRSYAKGNQYLKVQLIDYKGADALYAGVATMATNNFLQENDEEMMRGCELGVAGAKGWETLQKKERKASVALGIGNRFFLAVEADNQDNTDFVKQVARTLDLRALAAL